MLSFLYNLVPSNVRNGITDTQVGTLNGKPVMRMDMQEARNEWQTLKELHFIDPNNPDVNAPFLSRMPLGAADIINKGSDTFYLLIQEAQARGFVANKDEVESLMTNNIADVPEEGSDERDQIQQCVNDFVVVVNLLNSDLQMVKTNLPVRELWKATDGQMLALNVVNFPAAHYVSKVGEPSETDIKNQFDTYSDRVEGDQTFGVPDDPMAFGYKYPNRVKVQYIGVKGLDLLDQAKASRSPQDWYVAAYNEFRTNRDQYDAEPVPSTQASKTTGASTQPSPEHVDDLDQDFAIHVNLVLDHLYQQSAKDLHDKIMHQITDALNAGYSAWHDAQAAGAATQADVSDYTSMSYMEDLAREIEKQYGVLPVIGFSDQFNGTRELVKLPNIGLTFMDLGSAQPTLFAEFAVLDPNSGGLSQWQPSEMFENYSGDTYLFRVAQLDPSHTPDLSEVREMVILDWKTAAAYKMALDDAKNLLADAQKRPFAEATQGMTVVTTDLFRPAQIVAAQMRNTGIPPLALTPVSSYFLAKDAQKLLTVAPGPDGRPVDVAELWPDAVACVIHLQQAQPLWDLNAPAYADMGAMRLSMQTQGAKLIADLCQRDSVAQRVNFVSANLPKPAGSP
jgi:hypothetical protein